MEVTNKEHGKKIFEMLNNMRTNPLEWVDKIEKLNWEREDVLVTSSNRKIKFLEGKKSADSLVNKLKSQKPLTAWNYSEGLSNACLEKFSTNDKLVKKKKKNSHKFFFFFIHIF